MTEHLSICLYKVLEHCPSIRFAVSLRTLHLSRCVDLVTASNIRDTLDMVVRRTYVAPLNKMSIFPPSCHLGRLVL